LTTCIISVIFVPQFASSSFTALDRGSVPQNRGLTPCCFGASPRRIIVKKLAGYSILTLLFTAVFGAVAQRESVAAALFAFSLATGFTLLTYFALKLVLD
jgi:hypothetical protein